MRNVLIFLGFFIASSVIGQASDALVLENKKSNSVHNKIGFQHLYKRSFDFTSIATVTLTQTNRPLSFYMPTHHISGMFCKMEYKIESTSKFAPRFRLGSVNYADWMEGKKPFMERYAR